MDRSVNRSPFCILTVSKSIDTALENTHVCCKQLSGLLLALIGLVLRASLVGLLDDRQFGHVSVDEHAEHVIGHTGGVATTTRLAVGVVLGEVFDGAILARLGLVGGRGGGGGSLALAVLCERVAPGRSTRRGPTYSWTASLPKYFFLSLVVVGVFFCILMILIRVEECVRKRACGCCEGECVPLSPGEISVSSYGVNRLGSPRRALVRMHNRYIGKGIG